MARENIKCGSMVTGGYRLLACLSNTNGLEAFVTFEFHAKDEEPNTARPLSFYC